VHPYQHAQAHPERAALILADTGERLTFRELDAASNRAAQLFRSLGLRTGDRIGLQLRNCLEYAVIYWGAQRSGLLAAVLSTHLKPAEAAYILNDSGARLYIAGADVGATPVELAARRAELIPGVTTVYSVGEPGLAGAESLQSALASMPATPIADQISGYCLVYSSGTTGRPKGILRPFKHGPIEELAPYDGTRMFDGVEPLVSFNAGPLYHSAPLMGMVGTQRLGGTAVSLRKFDAEQTLKAIQDCRVTHAQFVPTMFVRMLALPEVVRRHYDLSSLQKVIHGAAPCPVEIKRRMIEWFGPKIDEYYSSSEAFGSTLITAEEWLRKPGSVGRAKMGSIHICSEDGTELPIGTEGLVYFTTATDLTAQYLNDPKHLQRARHAQRADWFTAGDIGRVDADGYLFLTDRKDFMIISGGVNIYPQAVEDTLIVHPKVIDAAVIGVPNAEYGEEVKAIVQLKDWRDASEATAAELIAWCQSRISRVTCPRSVQFVPELPRLPSGKLAKHELRRLYGVAAAPAVV
jgi:long-chain acyl-CoA synthetase